MRGSRQSRWRTLILTSLIRKLGDDGALHSADFRRFWFSSVLTNFGAQITNLALPLCAVLLLHATPAQMGRLAALQSLPFLLFGLPAGVLFDRNRRLPIIQCSDAMFALALASVPLAWWLGWLSMPWLYAVGFMMGTGFVVGGGAEQVYLTFLVGRDGLIDAQTKFAATDSAARLVGPGIAGVLVQLLTAPFAILVNVVGFVVSLWNLSRIRVREPQPAAPQSHVLREIHDGLVFVWRHPLLRTLAWAAGFWHFLFYGFTAMQVLFATRVLGMSPGVLGMAQMLGGVGVLVSSMMLKPLTRRFGTGATILIGMCTTVLGFVLMPAIPHALFGNGTATAAAYAIVVFLFDCGAMLFFMPYVSLRQRVTPDAVLGRMVSTMRFLTVATAPLGALAGGAIADQFSVRTGLACVGAGAFALAFWMVFATSLRNVKD
ncbi:MAG: MFS transporter [Pseudomonadota bacterium]